MAIAVHHRTLRFLALLLLVLAVSPVTAPFSPCDLQALLFDHGLFVGDVKSKAADDRTVLDSGAHPALELACLSAGPPAPRTCGPDALLSGRDIPLRI